MTKIVTLGGGTGHGNLAQGLRLYSKLHPHTLPEKNISAIVATTDDGGHSGQLLESRIPKDSKGQYLPPGDIRQLLVAYANDTKMQAVYDARVKDGANKNASIGNIIIDSYVERFNGNFEKAIEAASRDLSVRAHIYPNTLKRANLHGILKSGHRIPGEEELVKKAILYNSPIEKVFITPRRMEGNPLAMQAIKQADKVVLSQGSLYTSLIPNILVKDIADAVRKTRGKVIYIVNIVTQRGETDGYTAYRHLQAVESYLGKNVIDRIIINKSAAPPSLAMKYEREGQEIVEDDLSDQKHIIRTNLFADNAPVLRHDPLKLAETILRI